MKYTRETGETHSKLISCMVQMVRGKKSLHNAGSRWAVGSSYTMHGPRGPREEFVTQCMVQVVRGKKPSHNAWSRWSVGRSHYTMPCPGGPWKEAVGSPVRHGGYG